MLALALAHVELARAEATHIATQIGQVAALGALAIVLVIFAAFLFVIGVSLGIGEFFLGSMGWGVIHGCLLFLSVAMAAVLYALLISGGRIAGALIVGILVGIAVGLVLGLHLPNRLYTAIGDATGLAVDPGTRPLVVAVIVWAVIGIVAGLGAAYRLRQVWGAVLAIVAVGLGVAAAIGLVGTLPNVGNGLVVGVGAVCGLVLGFLAGRASDSPPSAAATIVGALVGAVIGAIFGGVLALVGAPELGIVVGSLVTAIAVGIALASVLNGMSGALAALGILTGCVLLGAFTAITFVPQVAAGIGITVAYLTWMALMAIDVSRTGIDVEALKQRFTPVLTIETSKETLEWLQKRMPPGIGS